MKAPGKVGLHLRRRRPVVDAPDQRDERSGQLLVDHTFALLGQSQLPEQINHDRSQPGNARVAVREVGAAGVPLCSGRSGAYPVHANEPS